MNFQLDRAGARWASFIGAALIYIYMLSVSLPALSTYAGGLAPFDMRPGGYSLQQATQLLQALGPAGRQYYLTHQLLADIAYPAFLALFIWQMLRFFASHLQGKLRQVLSRSAAWAPLVLIFDYGENMLIAAMLQAETLTASLVTMASFLSRIKAITTSLFLTVLLLAALAYCWRRWCKPVG